MKVFFLCRVLPDVSGSFLHQSFLVLLAIFTWKLPAFLDLIYTNATGRYWPALHESYQRFSILFTPMLPDVTGLLYTGTASVSHPTSVYFKWELLAPLAADADFYDLEKDYLEVVQKFVVGWVTHQLSCHSNSCLVELGCDKNFNCLNLNFQGNPFKRLEMRAETKSGFSPDAAFLCGGSWICPIYMCSTVNHSELN
jgi:hypothetical protein